MPFPLEEGGPAGPDEGRVYCGTPIADGNGKAAPHQSAVGAADSFPLGEAMLTQSTNDP